MVWAMIVASTAGCASLKGSVFPYEPKDIQAAKEQGDMALLKKVCDGEARVRYDSSKSEACTAIKRAEAVSGGTAKDGTKGGCDTLVKRYEETSQDWDTHKALAKQFVECKFYKQLFEMVVHWGNSNEGTRLLGELEDEGHPIEAEFVKYANEHKGAKFLAVKKVETKFALKAIGGWLTKKGHTGHCKLYGEVAQGASETARVWMMPYLKDSKCKEGVGVAVELLLSDSATHRRWACQTLAVVGTPKEIRKLKVLAQTDSYSQVREEQRNGRIWAVKEWPVREACKSAVGKIQLRH